MSAFCPLVVSLRFLKDSGMSRRVDVTVCGADVCSAGEERSGSAAGDVSPRAQGPPTAVPRVPILCGGAPGCRAALTSNPIHGQKPPQCSTGFSWCGTSTGPNAGNGLYGHRAAGLGGAGHRGTCWAAGDFMLQQRCLCLPVPQRGHWCVPAVPGRPAELWCSDAAVCGQVSVCVMLVDTKRGRRSSSCSIYMAFVISVAIQRYFRHVGGPEQWRSRTWGCPQRALRL